MRNLIRSTGGRRPALNFVAHAVAARFGVHGALRCVDWSRTERLVFVCSGNICRSPYAAERARQLSLPVASFGVDASGNAPADATAQTVARDRKVNLDAHLSVGLKGFLPKEGDLLLGLEPRHLKPLTGGLCGLKPQLTLLGLWCNPMRPYLPDPYGKSPECFDFVFRLIDEALGNIAQEMAHR